MSGRSSFTTVQPPLNPNLVMETKYHSPILISSNETIATENSHEKQLISYLKRFKKNNREFLAEFLGTLIMIVLICGIAAEEILHINGQTSALAGSLGTALGVFIAIGITGHISGAHMNPTVTLMLYLFDGFPAHKVPIYILAQFLGSFSGSALLYWMIEPAITHFDGGKRQISGKLGTAGIFGTYPPTYANIRSAILSEIFGTCLLTLIILGSRHVNNAQFNSSQATFVALGVFSICTSLGYTSGFSINPVRDFGPRLFTAVAGWGIDVFTVYNHYAVIPLLIPFIGALLGGTIYSVFID